LGTDVVSFDQNKNKNIKNIFSQNLTASMKQPQVPVYPVCGLYKM